MANRASPVSRSYLSLASAALRSEMSYRGAFLLHLAGLTLLTATEIVAIAFLFGRFGRIAGWSVWEVLYLYGVTSMAFATAEFACAGFDRMPDHIREGTFDRFLTRPVPALVSVLGSRVEPARFGRFLQGLAALAVGAHAAGVAWSALSIAILGASYASAFAIHAALYVLSATTCFWTVQSTEVFNAFTYGGVQITTYPVSVYRPWIRNLFLFVVPLGLAIYYPALAVLDKDDPLGFPGWTVALAPVSAAIFLGLALAFWRRGVDHYQSTGS